ncbi:MAG: amidase [Solirubrobacterales bacterium]|jgi:amidase|nr:amidase [Solirubrobacterales bacterium]
MDLVEMDATAQADLVRSGEASPEELVEAAISRIEEVNPQLNAVIHELFEEGLAEASSPDLPDGPFKGIPFLFKDLGAAYAGQPYHLGMKLLKEAGFRAPVDTILAERFRAAGFVVIGKTNTPELGILPTTEPEAYGASRNPWNTEHTTGGSSGGSGAAVASGMVPVAHANDGGGSIRIPASANGLVGLKTTRQRVSEGPLIGDNMTGLTVELCVSRTVRDTAAILDAVEGSAPGDPYVAPAPARPYVEELEADRKLRIGVQAQPPVPGLDSHPECVAAVEGAAKLLESLGHTVEESSPVDPQVAETLNLEDSFMTRWAAGQAATLEQLGAIVGREITADDVEPLTWALAEEGRSRSSARYLLDHGLHQLVARGIAAWFEGGYDLLLTPTMAEPPVPLGTYDQHVGDPLDAFRRAVPAGAFTAIFNATGQPAISLPLHWSADGLPVGVQLVAAFGREDLLIDAAAQLEAAQPWHDRRPAVFAGEHALR